MDDMFHHYFHGKGKVVSLHDIGHLRNIIYNAQTDVQDKGGTPYQIVGTWSTRLEATIKKDSSKSKYSGN